MLARPTCNANRPRGGRDRLPRASRRVSLLGPVGPEFLKVGPKVSNVLVVLDTDESHAGARQLLHRRVDVFVEGLLAPDDPGRFVGLGVIESLEGASLAAVDAVERGAEFDLGPGSDVVARGAQTLEHSLACGRILRPRRSARSRKRDGGSHPCPHDVRLFSPVTPASIGTIPRPLPDWMTRKRPHINAQVGASRPANAIATPFRMAIPACSVNGPKRQCLPLP